MLSLNLTAYPQLISAEKRMDFNNLKPDLKKVPFIQHSIERLQQYRHEEFLFKGMDKIVKKSDFLKIISL
jgi:hypothetical protein